MVLLLYIWVFNQFGSYFGDFSCPILPWQEQPFHWCRSWVAFQSFLWAPFRPPQNIGCSCTSVSWNGFWNPLVKVPEWSLRKLLLITHFMIISNAVGLHRADCRLQQRGIPRSKGSFPALLDACWLLSERGWEVQRVCGAASLCQLFGVPLALLCVKPVGQTLRLTLPHAEGVPHCLAESDKSCNIRPKRVEKYTMFMFGE